MQRRLIRQNPGRISVSNYEVRTTVIGHNQAFKFKILQGETSTGLFPGIPYRVVATAVDPAVPLFGPEAGHFDYRLNGNYASACGSHDFLLGEKLAFRVKDEYRRLYRGIGRSLVSIAFNHALMEGARLLSLSNVIALEFFQRLEARVVEVYDEDSGPVALSDVDPADPDVVINMNLNLRKRRAIPEIMISLRSEPLADVLTACLSKP